MSESEPTLYGNPKTNQQARLTDAQLAQQWARKAANEDRLDLASALYAIAGRARRIELAEAKTDHEQGLRDLRKSYEQIHERTRVVPLIGATRAEEPCSHRVDADTGVHAPLAAVMQDDEQRSHAPASCAVCGTLIRWFAPHWWKHADMALDSSHTAEPTS